VSKCGIGEGFTLDFETELFMRVLLG